MTDQPLPATPCASTDDSPNGLAEAGTVALAPAARPAFSDPRLIPPASPTVPGLTDPRLQELTGEVQRLRETGVSLRRELATARQAHRDDLAAIGRVLLREAEPRSVAGARTTTRSSTT